MGGEAVALGAVALDELLAVAIAQGALEVLAKLAIALAVLDVVDVAAGGEVGGGDPSAGALLELGDEAHQEGEEGVGEGDLLAVEEDDVAPPAGAGAGDVEEVAAEVTVAFVVGELGIGEGGKGGEDPGRRAALERGQVGDPEIPPPEGGGERCGEDGGGAEFWVDGLAVQVERRGDDDGPGGAVPGETGREGEKVGLGGLDRGEAGEDEGGGAALHETVPEEVEAGGDPVGASAEAVVPAHELHEHVEGEAVAGEVVLREERAAGGLVLGADGVVAPLDADDVHRADVAAVGDVAGVRHLGLGGADIDEEAGPPEAIEPPHGPAEEFGPAEGAMR